MGWWCKQLLKANPELELGQLVLFKHELRKQIVEAATAYPLLMSLEHTPKGIMKMALEAGDIAPNTLPRGIEMQLRVDGSVVVKMGADQTPQIIYAVQKPHRFFGRQLAA